MSRLGLDEALGACADRVARGSGGAACFVNVHTLTEATRDPTLCKAMQSATYLFADGMPLVWLARAKRQPIASRVCGPDFMDAMLRKKPGVRHGFIGSTPAITDEISVRYNIDAVSYSPPVRPFSEVHALEDWDAFVARCPGHTPPAFVWVGLGAPKQELWVATVSAAARGVMFFGVGAAFDFLARARLRAPRVLQRLGLEWTHRLAIEPRRLWRRYLVANTRFALLAVREVTGSRRS